MITYNLALEGATGLDEYSKNVINTGFNTRGVIESEKIMLKPSRQSLTAMLKRFFCGGKKVGKILILDEGMKFKGLSLSLADMNLLQQKSFAVEDKENNQLKMRALLPDTSVSRDIYELVKSGVLREFNFGFNKPKSKWKIGRDGVKERSLVDFDIHEISIVRVGPYNETQAYVRFFEEINSEERNNNVIYNCN